MLLAVRHAYGQARMQARFSRQASTGEWTMLESVSDIAGFLQRARATNLGTKAAFFHADATPEILEGEIRSLFRNEVDEVASWQPAVWQKAVKWLRVLPDIPVVLFLMRGGRAYNWMLSDPDIMALAAAAPEARLQALLHSPYAPLAIFWRSARSEDSITTTSTTVLQPADAWHAHWVSILPMKHTLPGSGIATVVSTTHTLMEALLNRGNGIEQAADQCANQYRRIFRHHTGTPAAIFAYLAMTWIELARLRGNLLIRRLFLPDESG